MPVTPSRARLSASSPYSPGRLGTGLHVGLVELDDVGPGGEQVPDLLVARVGVRESDRSWVAVEVVLRLLRHRERAGHRHLHGAVGVGLEELEVTALDRTWPADRADHAGHRVRVAAAVQRLAGVVDVDALERRGEVVGVALPACLAVGQYVETCGLLGTDREHRRVVLGLLERVGSGEPQLPGPHPRREPAGQPGSVDQPVRLRIAADQRGGEERKGGHRRLSCTRSDIGLRTQVGTTTTLPPDGSAARCHAPAMSSSGTVWCWTTQRPSAASRRTLVRASARALGSQRVVRVAEDAARAAAQGGRGERRGVSSGRAEVDQAAAIAENQQRGCRRGPADGVDDEVDRRRRTPPASAWQARRHRWCSDPPWPLRRAAGPARECRRLERPRSRQRHRARRLPVRRPGRRRHQHRGRAPARRRASRRARSGPSRPPPRTGRVLPPARRRRPEAAARCPLRGTTATSARLPSPGRIPASVLNQTRVPGARRSPSSTTPTPWTPGT